MKAIWSASGKHSQRFTFSTFCYLTASFQNGLILVFPSRFSTHHPIFYFWEFCKFFKDEKKKKEKSHLHQYSQPLLSTWGTFIHPLRLAFSDLSRGVRSVSSLAPAGPLKESLLGALCQTPRRLPCALASLWPLDHTGLTGGLLQTWLSFWEVLLSLWRTLELWSSDRTAIRFLVTPSDMVHGFVLLFCCFFSSFSLQMTWPWLLQPTCHFTPYQIVQSSTSGQSSSISNCVSLSSGLFFGCWSNKRL